MDKIWYQKITNSNLLPKSKIWCSIDYIIHPHLFINSLLEIILKLPGWIPRTIAYKNIITKNLQFGKEQQIYYISFTIILDSNHWGCHYAVVAIVLPTLARCSLPLDARLVSNIWLEKRKTCRTTSRLEERPSRFFGLSGNNWSRSPGMTKQK